MKNFHLVMPMGGKGQRFFNDGYVVPKPLIEINNRPFFYWSTMSILKYNPDCDVTFVVLREHIEKFDIEKRILSYFPQARVEVIPEVLAGAVLTCMAGVENINDDRPVLFNDCDHMFCCSEFNSMDEKSVAKYDGLLFTFKSDLPQFSYALCDENGVVIRTQEKVVISDNAICGAYYFRNKDIFLENAKRYLSECEYSEYFMSGVYNSMIKNKLISGVVSTDYHISFGTPAEYHDAVDRPEFGELL